MIDFDIHIKNASILIVDDNPANISVLSAMLEEMDYRNVCVITDAREVIPQLTRTEFDLVLLDIRMPHLDGIAILQLLANMGQDKHDHYLPVLVLTAQNDEATRKAALAAGAKDFLTKPFQQWEVLLRIHNLLETRMFYKAQRSRAELLEMAVRSRTQEIRDTQIEIIRRLGQAAEFRDNETGAHVMRMSHYAQMLALAAGYTAENAEMLLIASPMHDIGKIATPDYILLKPGKLTPEEFTIIQAHTRVGFQMLDGHPSELMQLAARIALSHHEKWDGSGYPNGLRGTAIPVEGRIVALADVFDALTSERPYKKAWSVERAVEHIRAQAGKHFDPDYAHLFIDRIDDILRIKSRFPDGENLPHAYLPVTPL